MCVHYMTLAQLTWLINQSCCRTLHYIPNWGSSNTKPCHNKLCANKGLQPRPKTPTFLYFLYVLCRAFITPGESFIRRWLHSTSPQQPSSSTCILVSNQKPGHPPCKGLRAQSSTYASKPLLSCCVIIFNKELDWRLHSGEFSFA